MTAAFARLTVVDYTGKRERLTVEILSENAAWIIARKVNNSGEECESHYDADGVLVEVTRMIDTATIRKRVPLVMNNHYGTLETAP